MWHWWSLPQTLVSSSGNDSHKRPPIGVNGRHSAAVSRTAHNMMAPAAGFIHGRPSLSHPMAAADFGQAGVQWLNHGACA